MKNSPLLLSILILFSCTEDKNIIYEQGLKEYFDIEYFNKIVIIPNEGCIGCISDATATVVNNIDKNKHLGVLFTRVDDEKLLKLKIENEIFKYDKRVKIDKLKLFNQPKFNTLYPLLVEIQNGKVSKIKVFNSLK